MFGTMRNNYSNSPAADADSHLLRSQNSLTKRGATMLLVLIVSAIIVGAVVWRTSSADEAASPQATIIDSTSPTLKQPVSQREEQATVMNPSDQPQPAESPHTTASVKVNGETVDLPASGNGSVHREVVTQDGSTTTVDIDMSSSTTGASTQSNSSSVRIDVQSSQVSESEVE